MVMLCDSCIVIFAFAVHDSFTCPEGLIVHILGHVETVLQAVIVDRIDNLTSQYSVFWDALGYWKIFHMVVMWIQEIRLCCSESKREKNTGNIQMNY
jgi:hypothetical protein